MVVVEDDASAAASEAGGDVMGVFIRVVHVG
jgi:hypothetical protein